MSLEQCPGCARHVRASETTCPFCATQRTASTASDEASHAPLRGSRSAVLFGAALGAIAVSSIVVSGGCAPAYGGPGLREDAGAPTDAATTDAATTEDR